MVVHAILVWFIVVSGELLDYHVWADWLQFQGQGAAADWEIEPSGYAWSLHHECLVLAPIDES